MSGAEPPGGAGRSELADELHRLVDAMTAASNEEEFTLKVVGAVRKLIVMAQVGLVQLDTILEAIERGDGGPGSASPGQGHDGSVNHDDHLDSYEIDVEREGSS